MTSADILFNLFPSTFPPHHFNFNRGTRQHPLGRHQHRGTSFSFQPQHYFYWMSPFSLELHLTEEPCDYFLLSFIIAQNYVLCFCSVLCLLCLCTRLFICALWSPAGKGLTSWLSFVVSAVSLSLSHWYPGSGVVLDCIDS